MKVWLLIPLLGVCLPYWTTADLVSRGNYQPIIDDGGILKNVTVIKPIPSDIDLSNLQIRRIEDNALDALTSIKTLNLSNNMLEELLWTTFPKLINLEELSLANNNISHLFEPFVELKNLKRLDLSHNSIFVLREYHLTGLSKSTEIIIEGNPRFAGISIEFPRISSIPVTNGEDIFDVLDSIFIKSNGTMPEDFQVKLCKTNDGTVKSLEEFNQNEPLGDCLKPMVDRLDHRIELNDLGIKRFERGWYKLTVDFVNTIDLTRNEIREITPELLNDLPVAINVALPDNPISTIKKNIMENKHCIWLNLGSNTIKAIEDGAFEKICLSAIIFEHNNLNNVDYIRKLPETIEFLGLSYNNITEIPSNIFRGLKKIRAIFLSYNNLEKIEPGAFDNLQYLSVIRLAGNRISQLNAEMFRNLPKLLELDLNHNKIMKIKKDTFSGIKSSYSFSLSLSYNEIDTIETGSFSHLSMETLELARNKITDESIANGAFNMTTVSKIELAENLLVNLNGELFSGISGYCDIRMRRNPIRSIKNFFE